MSDLVQRLRNYPVRYSEGKIMLEAADRIDELESTLRKIVEYETANKPLPLTYEVARNALSGSLPEKP